MKENKDQPFGRKVSPSQLPKEASRVLKRRVESILEEEVLNLLSDVDPPLDPSVGFLELGISSYTGVELVEGLSRRLGLALGVEIIFDYQCIEELSEHIVNQHRALLQKCFGGDQEGDDSEKIITSKENIPPRKSTTPLGDVTQRPNFIKEKESTFTPQKQSPDQDQGVAVIGVSCRFPEAENIEAFWSNLVQGHCAIKEVARTGWDVQQFYDSNPEVANKSISKWGGTISGNRRI